MDQKFLQNYDATELKTASEFLSNWLPFLSRGLCISCTDLLSDRIRSMPTSTTDDRILIGSTPVTVDRVKQKDVGTSGFSAAEKKRIVEKLKEMGRNGELKGHHKKSEIMDLLSNRIRSMPTSTTDNRILTDSTPVSVNRVKQKEVGTSWSNDDNGDNKHSLGSLKGETEVLSCKHGVEEKSASESVTQPKKSWADMPYVDELAEEQGNEDGTSSDEEERMPKIVLSTEQREYMRFRGVGRKKDFAHLKSVHGKMVNIVDGLELHTSVFSAAEQKRIVENVEQLQEMGRNGELKEQTYSAPAKWRGKGRVTLQFGCCYNYANDNKGNPPGIMKNELVDPLPHLFKVMIKRLVRWHVLPPSSVPDSCIVNIYDEGDYIRPHIDNHDFLRPFCTVSFLSECKIIFGSNLIGPGEFARSFAIPLPVGSVLVLNGNGADVAEHCVPPVPSKRISITFRKMDESKRPDEYVPEPDLQVQPINQQWRPGRGTGR